MPSVIKVMLHMDRATVLRSANQRPIAATANFCSWGRLAEHLRKSGEVNPDEEIEAMVIEDGGLTIYYRGK